MERVKVTIYTDPGCPFGFNAQRQELQMEWHYGGGLDITRRMIVLTEKSSAYEELGLSREMVVGNLKRLRSTYGMPMMTEPPDRLAATIEACRAYVGARIHDPARVNRLLRALRCRAFSNGEPLDQLETIQGAAADVGIEPDALDAWLADGEVENGLREDMAATRDPAPEALALAHRLSKSDGGLRYSTASAVFEADGRRVVMPGFQPFAVYEVSLANVPLSSSASQRPSRSRRSSPGRRIRSLPPRWPSFAGSASSGHARSSSRRVRTSPSRPETATGRPRSP